MLPEHYVITDHDIQYMKSDLDDTIKNEGPYPNAPEFQTYPHLFNQQILHWQRLRNNFGFSIATNMKISYLRAWGYINYPGIPNQHFTTNEPQWHKHDQLGNNGETKKICGVYYLSLPDDCETTCILNEDGSISYFPKIERQWFFFDKDTMHSPGKWSGKSSFPRYCISAEAYFEND
jgi:hypothetical protein